MPQFDATLVKCPYYIENFSKKQSAENRIRCEGIDSNNKINLVFGNKGEKRKYMVRYCYGVLSCKKCRINKMLTEKYGDDDDE